MALLKIGVSIQKDIFNGAGGLVLPANSKLKQDDVARLINHRIDLSQIKYGSGDGDDAQTDTLQHLLEDTTGRIKDIFDSIKQGHSLPLRHVEEMLVPSIRRAAEASNLFQLLNKLRSKDDHTFQHNVGVGVMAALLGKWLKLDESELSLLTLAGTLHDVGKMKVPNDLIHKPGKLNDDEYGIMKKHTLWGYEILNNTPGSSPRLAIVALQHHEREDGSGYPLGLRDEEIDYFSKIVGIVDVFHAMTSHRSYHAASSFFTVIKQMNSDVFGKFNANIFFVFMKKIMESLIGSEALLNDGSIVKIVLANPYDPINPLVQCEDRFIDLSKDRSLQLQEIMG